MDNIFTALYELIIGQQGLPELLHRAGAYSSVGSLMLTLSFFGMTVYYYVINHPRFNKWSHWLLTIGVISLINFLIAYFIADGVVWQSEGTVDGYIIQMITFGLANLIWTIVFSFLFSMCLKWGSRNAKYSPF